MLFDLQTASEGRWREERGQSYRLEHYYFHCNRNGYEFEFQEGWPEGGHYGGGTANNDIPEAWLSGTWKQFVDAFCEAYPASWYFISRDEIYNNLALKSFLGF